MKAILIDTGYAKPVGSIEVSPEDRVRLLDNSYSHLFFEDQVFDFMKAEEEADVLLLFVIKPQAPTFYLTAPKL